MESVKRFKRRIQKYYKGKIGDGFLTNKKYCMSARDIYSRATIRHIESLPKPKPDYCETCN